MMKKLTLMLAAASITLLTAASSFAAPCNVGNFQITQENGQITLLSSIGWGEFKVEGTLSRVDNGLIVPGVSTYDSIDSSYKVQIKGPSPVSGMSQVSIYQKLHNHAQSLAAKGKCELLPDAN